MSLKPETRPEPDPLFFVKQAAGLVALLLGMVGFIVVAVTQEQFCSQPDLRLATPFLIGAIAAAAVTCARREGAI